jgi:flagellar hook-length control protein FliK
MQILGTPLAARTPAPSVADSAPSETAAGSDFASLLDRQARATRPAETDAGDTDTDSPDTGSRSETPHDSQAARQDRSARLRAQAKPVARPVERQVARETDGPADRRAVDEARAKAPDTDAAPDATLLGWLAALHLPSPAVPGGGGVDTSAAPNACDTGMPGADVQTVQRPATGPSDGSPSREPPGEFRAMPRDRSAGTLQRAAASQLATADVEPAAARSAPAEGARGASDTPAGLRCTPADAALPTLATAPPVATASERVGAPPTPVPMATPIDDPQFPRAFGVQVSVLARDGVQQAELHLNPAEMGPVSVQIVMDGTQARIDFGADAAGTRQLIEHSLPELAAALREAGLTLTGGGVSQHSSSGRDDGTGATPPPRPGDAAAAAADTPTRPLRHNLRAGGVDVYA